MYTPMWGFPGGSVVKNLPANAGDMGDLGSTPGSERFPGGDNYNPLQYSCLEKSHGQRSLGPSVHEITESDTTDQLSMHTCIHINKNLLR